MQVRPVTGTPRQRYHHVRRLMQGLLRWTFIVIGALATATVLFSYLYHVNEEFYDPSLFAIGVGGLFSIACGAMLMLVSRNSRLSMELRRAKIRCEALADSTWELKESEARAASLLEAQGDLIVRRDNAGRITYVNDAYCAFAGRSREALIGTTHALPSLQQGRLSVLPDGTRLRDEQIDVVHVMIPMPLGLAAVRVAKAMGLPVVMHSHTQPENIFMNVPRFPGRDAVQRRF